MTENKEQVYIINLVYNSCIQQCYKCKFDIKLQSDAYSNNPMEILILYKLKVAYNIFLVTTPVVTTTNEAR